MMDQDRVQELMDDVIRGTATPSQKEQLDSYLQNDSSLKEEYRLRRVEHEALEILVQDNLRHEMEAWDQSKEKNDLKEDNVFQLKPILRVLSIAASIAIVAGFFYWNASPTTDTMTIAMSEYQPNFSSTRALEDSNDPFDVIRQILLDKTTNEYQRAETTLIQLTQNPEYANRAYLYLGHLKWAQGDYKRATTFFASVSEDSDITSRAKFYQALSLLANSKTEEARVILGDLSHSNGNQAVKARRILEKLN